MRTRHLVALVSLTLALGARAEPQKFRMYGVAQDGADPQNAKNDVLVVDTTGGRFGGVIKPVAKGTKVRDLTNQLSFKWFFVGRSCAGGAPRMAVLIDLDGDGFTDEEILGYGGAPPFTGCPANTWSFTDMTDAQPRWDLRYLGGPTGVPWSAAVAFVEAGWPGHQVTAGALDDDGGLISGSPNPAAQGLAAYDVVTIGDDTLDERTDTIPYGNR